MRRFVSLSSVILLCLAARFSSADPGPGWTAELTTRFHLVEGTVTVVDSTTIRVDDFHFDGLGLSVYFYLGASNSTADFVNGIAVGPELVGTPFNGGSLVMSLPPGETIDGYFGVTVWCVDVAISFGDGTFQPPAACDGDVDGNFSVNVDDITYTVLRMGMSGAPGSVQGDADGSGTVDVDDITYIVLRLGSNCS